MLVRGTRLAPCLICAVWAVLALACEQPECSVNSDCTRAGAMCINGECAGPPCSDDSECSGDQCIGGLCRARDAGAGVDAGRRDGGVALDAGRRDAGSVGDGGGADASAVTDAGGTGFDASGGGEDAGNTGTDAGSPPVDGGRDAGPPCVCTPSATQTQACGTCGLQYRTCGGDCQWGAYGGCLDSNSRCFGGQDCRNDVCWGYTFATSTSTECIDLGFDSLPGDPTALGFFDVEVVGRPGASWRKENAHTSCSGGFLDAPEFGTLDGSGRDTDPGFYYGASDCTNGNLGQFQTRMRINDGGDVFYLSPVYTHNFFNSSCGADRNTCGTVNDLCF